MESIQASKERQNQFMGIGAGIQAAGVALFLLSLLVGGNAPLFGFLIMIGMLIWGGVRSKVWLCGHCKNQLGSKEVRVCPSCHANLT